MMQMIESMTKLVTEVKQEVGALVDAQGLYRAMLVVDVSQKLDQLTQMIQEGTDNGNHPD